MVLHAGHHAPRTNCEPRKRSENHSRLADDAVPFCDAAIARLDTTGFSFKGADGDLGPVNISTTVIDARVFTLDREPEPRDDTLVGSVARKPPATRPQTHKKEAQLNPTKPEWKDVLWP